jgi:hypothetical protein
MGVRVWTFLRSTPGEIIPVAQRAVDAFFANTGRLAADQEGLVRYAEVIVNLENRRAVEVLRVGFFQYRAREDGRIDLDHSREVMATVQEASLGRLQLTKPPPGVVDAGSRFAKRRLQHLNTWKPTQGELAKLRRLVNGKAGRGIL